MSRADVCAIEAQEGPHVKADQHPIVKMARSICETQKAAGVAVFVFRAPGEQFVAASYGSTRERCKALGAFVDEVCDAIMTGDVPVEL